ncbi:MAG: oxaloacetate decarboxylase subunit alpha, partial [Archaeoglobaceae archaeon]
MVKVRIIDLTMRDGHQSLLATRMRTRDILPVLEKFDAAGIYSFEVWGGATFDVCHRFLNENPWERLREIRKRVKNTLLQMLLRGQNLVGYR